MIALDIDGTLLDSKGKISSRTRKKIESLIEKDKYVALASGRASKAAANIKEELSLDLPIISYNGSALHLQGGEKVLDRKIPLEDALEVIEFAENKGIFVKAYIDDLFYIEKDHKLIKAFSQYQNIGYRVVGKLSEYIKEDVNMIVFIYDELSSVDLDMLFKDLAVTTARSTPFVVEFMAKGATKAAALKLLASHLGIKKEEILAVGNALNDLEMIEYAGTGFAMKNSDPDLLKKWDRVSDYSNDEEGVYHIIKDL